MPRTPNPLHRNAAMLLCVALAGTAAADPAAMPGVRVWVEWVQPPDPASLRAVQALGGKVIARTRHPVNAVAVRIAADRVDALRDLPGVARVRPADVLHPPDLNPGADRHTPKNR